MRTNYRTPGCFHWDRHYVHTATPLSRVFAVRSSASNARRGGTRTTPTAVSLSAAEALRPRPSWLGESTGSTALGTRQETPTHWGWKQAGIEIDRKQTFTCINCTSVRMLRKHGCISDDSGHKLMTPHPPVFRDTGPAGDFGAKNTFM